MNKPVLMALVVATGLAAGSVWLVGAALADNVPNRIYEMRTVTATAGNMAKLMARFQDEVTWLYLKHGMQIVGYWTPLNDADGEDGAAGNRLIYILSHKSRDEARYAWQRLGADPEWQAVIAATTADGPLIADDVATFLEPTDFSPMR
jgi:hypothetical protein